MGSKIGFVGLGIMGNPMAGHLMKAGYEVIGFDLVPEALAEFVSLGGIAASSSQEAAAQCDIFISMVPDSPHVEAVYLGENGVLVGARPDTLLLDMSSISPVMAIKVAKAAAEHGCPMLDAPVSGGQVGAQQATLSIMVGGDPAVYERALPIFEILGKPTYCGPSGAGQTVKACNQIQVAMNFIGLAEALVLGTKAGVDPEIIIKVLSAGYAQTRVMDVRGPRMINDDFEPGFRAAFHYKDLNIIREAARAYGASLPASALAHELFSSMMANGWGNLDHSAVVKVIAMLSNTEFPPKAD
ncbi:MAG: 2-hydroxy-3-oxopropionate reductase [Anaerolineae bacterium]|jgi:2-hydroxy-3-oxopropionate reductase|nr:2-hydroxy-3-oxopropionate reductase [Chloroflexota bacterium]